MRHAFSAGVQQGSKITGSRALAGFVLARASAGLADSHYPQRHRAPGADPGWFGRPLWEMRPEDADAQVPDRLLPATPLTGAPQGWWLPDGVP